MKLKEIEALCEGDWIAINDGSVGVFMFINQYCKDNGYPYVRVELLCIDGFGRVRDFWPAQIKGLTTKHTVRNGKIVNTKR